MTVLNADEGAMDGDVALELSANYLVQRETTFPMLAGLNPYQAIASQLYSGTRVGNLGQEM